MRIGRRTAAAATVLVSLGLVFCLGRATARDKEGSAISGVFGVGGVITENGGLWQYLPDEKRWMTIDEAFHRDQRETHILPLPVDAKAIRFMESWGFLVTQSGDVWQYDLDTNKWQNIGTP